MSTQPAASITHFVRESLVRQCSASQPLLHILGVQLCAYTAGLAFLLQDDVDIDVCLQIVAYVPVYQF